MKTNKSKGLSIIGASLLVCTIVLFMTIGNSLPDNIEIKAQKLKEYCAKTNHKQPQETSLLLYYLSIIYYT